MTAFFKIDGKSTEKMQLNAAIKALKGKTGEKAKLTILRPIAGAAGGGTIFDVELTRETIRISSVKDARLLPGHDDGAGEDRLCADRGNSVKIPRTNSSTRWKTSSATACRRW